MTRPRVLLLGHYPLDRPDRAPVVRTWAMAESLARYVALTAITGTRADRARWARRFLDDGGLLQVDGVYVEAGTSTMTPMDHRLLMAVRRRRLPLAIYIRDAYQRFPELYPPRNVREWLLARAYAVTTARYRHLATTLFFPTAGLADLFPHRDARLLPPAGRVLTPPPDVVRHPFRVIYVGANGPYDGVGTLVAAMETVVTLVPAAELVLVLRPEEAPARLPAGCRLVAAHGATLSPWLFSSALAVIPRQDTAYTRLALPIKLFDYLSHGLPVVATGPSETSKLVVREQVGVAVRADVGDLARTLAALLGRPAQLRTMGDRARALVAERHNWDARAREVLAALHLGEPPELTAKLTREKPR